jgi:Flp pilus assembly pilin Flp
MNAMSALRRLVVDEGAQGMTEYAILVGIVSLGAIGTVALIGNKVKNILNSVSNALDSIPTS